MMLSKTINVKTSDNAALNIEGKCGGVPGCGDCPKCGLWSINISHDLREYSNVSVLYCEMYGKPVNAELRKSCEKLAPKPKFETAPFNVASVLNVPVNTRLANCIGSSSGQCEHIGVAHTINDHLVLACYKDKSNPVPLNEKTMDGCNHYNMRGAQRACDDKLKLKPTSGA